MSSLNSVTLVGRAGNDPSLRNLGEGNQVCNISMAVDRPTKNKETDWFDIQIWGNTADNVKKYLKKGHRFGVTGSLKVEKWEKDGAKHQKVVIVANRVSFMETKKDNEGDSTNTDTDFFSGDGGVNLG